MLDYIPRFYEDIAEANNIIESESNEIYDLDINTKDVLKQFFVETATEWGLDLWEQMLGLASYTGKPLDQRRSRIISKIRGTGTITVNLIKNVAESFIYGKVEVREYPSQCSFTVKFVDDLGVPPNLEDLMQAIEDIKPAHLKVEYEYKYLLLSQVHENMTISEIENRPLTDFAPFVPIL